MLTLKQPKFGRMVGINDLGIGMACDYANMGTDVGFIMAASRCWCFSGRSSTSLVMYVNAPL